MIRSCASLFFWLSMTIGASLMLYHTSDRVAALDHRLRDLNKEIEAEDASLHILKAEWVYLANPARVETQAYRHLSMLPTELRRIMTAQTMDKALPLSDESMRQLADASREVPSEKMARDRSQETPAATVAMDSKQNRTYATLNEGRINDHMVIQHPKATVAVEESGLDAPGIADIARGFAGAAGTTEGLGSFIGTLGLSQ